jgi:hypothetical protein
MHTPTPAPPSEKSSGADALDLGLGAERMEAIGEKLGDMGGY